MGIKAVLKWTGILALTAFAILYIVAYATSGGHPFREEDSKNVPPKRGGHAACESHVVRGALSKELKKKLERELCGRP